MSARQGKQTAIGFDEIVGGAAGLLEVRTVGEGPAGRLPLTPEMLLEGPSGDVFGWTQNAGMGWDPRELGRPQFLILSTQGGIRAPDGQPIALGYHTGHWEVGLLMEAAANELRRLECLPFAGFVTDPCDGRTQGTVGMMDSLPYRNDAAQVFRRLIRSLPTRRGVLGVATCDKGLPAMMMALAGMRDLPCVLVPGGVTLPARDAEDAGTVQSIGARFAHGEITLERASDMGCRACGSAGGGCQFLGTAATSQVVGEALGLALPHSALAPSGQPIWLDAARRSARALVGLRARGLAVRDILTDAAVRNAMVVHAAFGGSTNLLLHLTAIAHAAGLRRPTVDDWTDVNRRVPRIVDVLPNGPRYHPTVRVFMAGGVPEVMLHLRRLGLLELGCLTASGETLGHALDWWEASERRRVLRERLRAQDGVDPDDVIMSPDAGARSRAHQHDHVPAGQPRPRGLGDQEHRHRPDRGGRGRRLPEDRPGARLHDRARGDRRHQEHRARAHQARRRPGADLPGAARHGHGGDLPDHRRAQAPLLRQARRRADRRALLGRVDGSLHRTRRARGAGRRPDRPGRRGRSDPDRGRPEPARGLDRPGRSRRPGVRAPRKAPACWPGGRPRPDLAPDPDLPPETRLWAALQAVGGGTWGGCVYDVDAITEVLGRGTR